MDATPPQAREGIVRVSLALARPTMVLARPILDRDGRVAVGSGTTLGPRVVQVLRRLAIQSVPVVASDDVAEWERLPDGAGARAELAARFAREPETESMKALHDAVLRCFERRARDASGAAGV
jgi:hypothetical protein